MCISNPAILIPVLDDWQSLDVLLKNIAATDLPSGRNLDIVVVDDGSRNLPDFSDILLTGSLHSIRIVSLKSNQGHQRALALGLAHIFNEMTPEFIIIMDSDGEDRPEELRSLILAHEAAPETIVVAQRQRRSEGVIFRLFYQLYKLLFMWFTGKPISFGNFSLIPQSKLSNVVFNSGVWNNLAATMLKSRVPITFVPTRRGVRYHGKSTMNFTSLMIHGFSAMAIFSDIVIGRVILILSMLSGIVALIVVAVIIIKFGSTTFVPGYATNIILFLMTFLSLSLLTGFLMILTLLSRRDQASALPTDIVKNLTDEVMFISSQKSSDFPKAGSR